MYSLEEKKYSKLSGLGGDTTGYVVWMPDNKHVVFAVEGRLVAVDRVTREMKEIFRPAGYGAADPAVTADGRMIFFNTVLEESDIWMATIE